jgi:hypothetical protein
MDTRSAPELLATKASRLLLYLGAGFITATIAYMMTLVWPWVPAANTADIKATAIADRQQSRRSELYQARMRWEDRAFDNYRLHIQFGSSDNPYCEKVFEVHEPVQTKTLSDTCAGRYDFELLKFLGVGGSVSGLFNYIDHEISYVGECGGGWCECHGARTIDVVYDTNDGYPKSVEERFEEIWPMKAPDGTCTAILPYAPRPFRVSLNPIK